MAALRAAHAEHPFYGVARLAIHLGWSEVKTRRIRRLAGVVVPTASKKFRHRRGMPEISPAPNVLGQHARFKDESRPQDGMSYASMTNVVRGCKTSRTSNSKGPGTTLLSSPMSKPGKLLSGDSPPIPAS